MKLDSVPERYYKYKIRKILIITLKFESELRFGDEIREKFVLKTESDQATCDLLLKNSCHSLTLCGFEATYEKHHITKLADAICRLERYMSAVVSRGNGNSPNTSESVNPGTEIASTCYTPPPSYHNINLPLGHPSTLTNDCGAPPSYEEAIDPNAPPPSYDSLFGRMREAHKVSKGVFDFLKNIIVLLLGTIGCTIILGVTIVVPICMMVIGGLYLYDCPQGEYIPVYLLVGGGFGVFKQLLHLSARVRQRQEERDEERIRQSPTQTLINCFMLGWFIIVVNALNHDTHDCGI
ncbi:hypothetical protein WN51_08124 [Melipona quadrifasciata]|uniref:Uncharacterized protein n=1 Tax=Melipona quadrifasciata TaxID=166423 RepID=A0A0N0U2W6_9HYME|nr:hypothetical protein WN51_08124 [Melipona quadrifasciata]